MAGILFYIPSYPLTTNPCFSMNPTMTLGLMLTTAPAGQGKSLWVSSEGKTNFQKTGWNAVRNAPQGSDAKIHPTSRDWRFGGFF